MVVKDVVSVLRGSRVPSRNIPARDNDDHTTEASKGSTYKPAEHSPHSGLSQ